MTFINLRPSRLIISVHLIAGMLFHRVILMSGSALSPWAVVRNPTQTTQQVASAFNCSLSNSWSHGGADDLVVGSPSGKIISFYCPFLYYIINVLYYCIFCYLLYDIFV